VATAPYRGSIETKARTLIFLKLLKTPDVKKNTIRIVGVGGLAAMMLVRAPYSRSGFARKQDFSGVSDKISVRVFRYYLIEPLQASSPITELAGQAQKKPT
jgi:hypothetical protein